MTGSVFREKGYRILDPNNPPELVAERKLTDQSVSGMKGARLLEGDYDETGFITLRSVYD